MQSIQKIRFLFGLVFILLFGRDNCFAQAFFTNDGLDLKIEGALSVTIPGELKNQTNATTLTLGTIDNEGTITLTGNWTNTSDPITFLAGSVELLGTATAQTITKTDFFDLTSNNVFATIPQIVLTRNTIVKNSLILTSGVYDLAGFTLSLGSAGVASSLSRAVSAGSNYLYGGTFKRFWDAGAITSNAGPNYGLFPIGSPSTDPYRPLEINSTAPTTGGEFTIAHSDQTGTTDVSGPEGIERIHNTQFSIATTVTDGTYDIALTMTTLSNTPGGQMADIRLATYNGGVVGIVGSHVGAAGTLEHPTAQRTGVTGAELNNAGLGNEFRIASTDAGVTPLPIELLNFDAKQNGKVVDLKWATASETNNDFFTIEKTKDGVNFQFVAKVKGSGNTTFVTKYYTVDYSPYEGVSYYRLKQTDYDGNFSYSDLVMVDFELKQEFSFAIYPNPNSGGNVTIALGAGEGQEVLVVVYDAIGNESYSKVILVEENGTSMYALDLSGTLAKGIYFIVASSKQNICKKKLIIN